ncbi:MAG TPA: hypothetical protein VGS22_02850 [Thermoanaerobaculia bacterium]|jgi:hypothetical protein|nr:hypothetical protein [Thermoanaerobaculia bacterium]
MGLFDTIHCEYLLPVANHQDLEYQTKGLDSGMERYTITPDGRLIRHSRGGMFARGPCRDIEWPVHGDVEIYTHDSDRNWIEYIVRFTHGRVEWIRSLEEARRTPGFRRWDDPVTEEIAAELPEPPKVPEDMAPASKASVAAEPEGSPKAEQVLLQNLQRDRTQLEKLLADASDHWGYEDPIYRFYHQSFKVFGLQRRTQAIVERLKALSPDLPLNPWFVQIVESGTGKKFEIDANQRWTEETRPILEAFFHARFFLEMAVRYANLKSPPRSLPSGYAALLYLFGLR